MRIFGYEITVRKISKQEEKREQPLFDVARVTLNPGDKVVLTSPYPMSMDAAQRLISHWDSAHPDCKAIVLPDGLKLSILGPSNTVTH